MYFPDRGCVHTLLTLYVYATDHHTKQCPDDYMMSVIFDYS